MNCCSVDSIYEMSIACTSPDKNFTYNGFSCLTHLEDEPLRTLRKVAGIWCIMNGVVGFIGNLLTLLAIPYASKRKK